MFIEAFFYPVTKNMGTYPKKRGRWVYEKMIKRMIECVRKQYNTMHLKDGIEKKNVVNS